MVTMHAEPIEGTQDMNRAVGFLELDLQLVGLLDLREYGIRDGLRIAQVRPVVRRTHGNGQGLRYGPEGL